jgi:hypothetical protein
MSGKPTAIDAGRDMLVEMNPRSTVDSFPVMWVTASWISTRLMATYGVFRRRPGAFCLLGH